MNEEYIINNIKKIIKEFKKQYPEYIIYGDEIKAIQGLLNLYEKSKEDVIKQYELGLTQGAYEKNLVWEDKIRERIDGKFKEARGLYERGVQPQAQYTMKLLRDLEEQLLNKEE